MARPVRHTGDAYSIPVVTKFNPQGLVVLDQLRGDTPRGAYLRELLRAEHIRRVKAERQP